MRPRTYKAMPPPTSTQAITNGIAIGLNGIRLARLTRTRLHTLSSRARRAAIRPIDLRPRLRREHGCEEEGIEEAQAPCGSEEEHQDAQTNSSPEESWKEAESLTDHHGPRT